MPEDSLVIVASVISVVVFIELVVAILLCIKFSRKRFGWFNCKSCKCAEDECDPKCLTHKKLHKYKIRKLSIQSSSSKSESRSMSVNNQVNWILPFPVKAQQQQPHANANITNPIFTIETMSKPVGDQNLQVHDERMCANGMKLKSKNRMNSYLYAINYKNIINQNETENFYKKSILVRNHQHQAGYKFNIEETIEANSQQDDHQHDHENVDIETTSTANLNTESPLTDMSIPSPPSSLNLVSLSKCPSPPTPLTMTPYMIKSDFESTESDELSQFKQRQHQNFISPFNVSHNTKSFPAAPPTQQEASLLSSISFIKFYLDKFDTQIQSPRLASNINDETNHNMKILNDYLSQSNAEEIIESTIELMKNFKPVINDK